ncbi:geranylgeranylglycerol-phosphate geranylgeranyltransferase [Bacteroidota bacterium]
MSWEKIIQTVMAFFRLVRYKNLIITILVQFMVYYCLIEGHIHFPAQWILLIVGATVLIASGGYIINDFYDLKADIINHPETVILGKRIKMSTAVFLYLMLNLIAFYFGVVIGLKYDRWMFILLFVIIAIILYSYARKLKRTPLIGNITVAVLLSFTLVIVWLYKAGDYPELLLLYASFAFLTGIIRELLKDLEDMEGDLKAGFFTFPISQGVPKSKQLVIWLTLLQIVAIIFFSLLVYGMTAYWALMVYFFLLVLVPLSLTLNLIQKAQSSNDYAQLTRFIKFIVVTGTVSMFALLL